METSQGATGHFDAEFDGSGRSVQMIRAVAGAYEASGHYREAMQFDTLVLSSGGVPGATDDILEQRCRLSAVPNIDLAQGLRDCNQAGQGAPDVANYYDSRGLVELRSGSLDAALKDYDRALGLSPGLAASLLGRSIAESRLGRQAQAASDFVNAAKADPGVADRFARWGVAAPGAAGQVARASGG